VHARSLTYLDACSGAIMAIYRVCAEGLAPRARRRAMDLGGHRVEPGQWLAVAAYSMHRNPAYWQAGP